MNVEYRPCLGWVLHCAVPTSIFIPLTHLSSPSTSIFLGILGVGLSILFCTTFCRACHRYREEEIERRARQRSEQDGHAPSIYFIPFSGNLNLDSDDHPREQRDSVDIYLPPRYSTMSYGPPPSYSEVTNQNRSMTDAHSKYLTGKTSGFNFVCHSMCFSWELNLRIFPLLTQNTMPLHMPSHPHLRKIWFNHKHRQGNNKEPSH